MLSLMFHLGYEGAIIAEKITYAGNVLQVICYKCTRFLITAWNVYQGKLFMFLIFRAYM